MGTFDDNRRQHAAAARTFREIGVPARPAGRRHRAAPRGRALPVRPGRPGPARAGLLRGLQHPGRRAGAAAAGDRPAEGRDRRLRRPRLDPRADRRGEGDGPARAGRAPTSSPSRCPASPPATHTKANAVRLATALGVTFEEIDIRPAARADAGRPRPPVRARASRSTTSRSRTSRPGCAPTTCSGSPTSAAGSCSAPATCPSSRWAGPPTAWATRCRTTTSTPACRRR